MKWPKSSHTFLSVIFLLTTLHAATETFTGRVLFEKIIYTRPDSNLNENTESTPAYGITIHALENNNSLGSTTTNSNGEFSLTVDYTTSVDLIAYTSSSTILVANTNAFAEQGETYSATLVTGTTSAGPHNLTVTVDQNSGAFNIFYQLQRGVDWWSSRGHTFSRVVKTFWPYGGGTQFDPQAFIIFMQSHSSDPDEFDDDIILHEFGHMSIEEFSKDDSVGGFHNIEGSYDLRLSWSEGAAHYISSAIRSDPIQVDGTGSTDSNGKSVTTNFSIESPSANAIGTDNEWAVAYVLWKAHQTIGNEEVLNTIVSFKQNLPDSLTNEAISMDTFFLQWDNFSNSSLQSYYDDRKFSYKIDNFSENLNSPYSLGAIPETLIHHDLTFFDQGDKDYFSFSAKSGEFVVIETNCSENGALTHVNLYQGLNDQILITSNAQRKDTSSDDSFIFQEITTDGDYLIEISRIRDSEQNFGLAEAGSTKGYYNKTAGFYGSYSLGVSKTDSNVAPETLFDDKNLIAPPTSNNTSSSPCFLWGL